MDVGGWFDFADRVVLVAGGAGAIGRQVATAFAERGARVILADVESSDIDAVVAATGAVRAEHVDISDVSAVEALVGTVTDEHGDVDVLVNTAAIYLRVPALDLTESDFDQTMDINVKGAWALSMAAGRRMIERGYGRIIHFTSNAGLRGSPLQLVYNASKAAVISMTKTLAVEWARTGVTVNAVAPGPTDTPLMAPAFADPQLIDAFAQRIPAGSLTPTDVTVGPVLFLASPSAGWITGHILFADGGMSAT